MTLFNVGGDTLRGSIALKQPSGDEFSLVGETSYRLAGGQSQAITVRFAPVYASSFSCSLVTSPRGCSAVAITGTGLSSFPSCFEPTADYDFGSNDYLHSTDRRIVLRNVGGAAISGTMTGAVGDFQFIDLPSYTLAPGQEADITVRFTSTGVGAEVCTLQVTPADTPGQCGPVVLHGTGYVATYGACSAAVTSGPLNFGAVQVGDSLSLPFTIKNMSASFRTTGDMLDFCPAFHGSGNGHFSLAPGETQTGHVVFKPTFPGSQSCAVLVSCENMGEGTIPGVQSYLTCRGVGAGLAPRSVARRAGWRPQAWRPARY